MNANHFEQDMFDNLSKALDAGIRYYAEMKAKKAPADILEKIALRIQKYEDQLYKLEMAIR